MPDNAFRERGRIVETSAAGAVTTTDFRYQGDAVVQEVSGSLTRDFVLDEQGTARKLTITDGPNPPTTYLVTWNGHGDAMALWRQETDGSLTLANSYTYDTWGRPTTATHNGIADLGFRFLYVGASDVQWDDAFGLGLLYMHARHYAPALGRSSSPTPTAARPTSTPTPPTTRSPRSIPTAPASSSARSSTPSSTRPSTSPRPTAPSGAWAASPRPPRRRPARGVLDARPSNA